jgi:hypothetical protein
VDSAHQLVWAATKCVLSAPRHYIPKPSSTPLVLSAWRQNSTEERYLLAREVVKASGVDYNTSAPNVVQRWFRAIMRRAKAHGLPLPSLPRRCCALGSPTQYQGCTKPAGCLQSPLCLHMQQL